MKIKPGYLLREVAGQFVVVPVGEAALNFNGVISLNKSGAFLWKLLQYDLVFDELVQQIVSTYQVTLSVAKEDAEAFINKMNRHGLLE